MTDIIRNRERLKVVEVFKMAISPFFQMISHPYVLSSPILEAPLDTICAFLFGPNGRRTIDVFGVSADALKELLENDSVDENEQLERMLTASLQVLQRIIDLNQTAQIIQEVSTIANNIADLMPTDRPLQAARKTILRIQQRLGIKVQTNKEKEQEYLQNVVFDINHDLPGNLSIEGQRHDNDHEDIMKIRILPTMDEIRSDRPEYLPPSSTNSGHIQGMAKLLDRQFRLFREDIIAPIRDVIRAELNEGKNGSGRHIRTGIRYFVYQDARLQQLRFDAKRGLLVVVEFDQPPAVTDMSARQRRDWWERTKQLSGDSLVCFISSAGRAIFFQVFNPHPIIQKTETGEDSEDPDHEDKYRRAASLFKDEGRASITLAMVEPSEEDIMWMTTHLESPQTLKLHQSLLEFPGVLLPAFQPTLQALQKMSQSPTTVPFSELLASETMTLHPPPYTQTRNFSFNLEAITNGKSLTFTPGRVFDHQEMHKMATLDGAQQISVMNALSRCFALIQGPPGTGKSYTGVSIIKVLLTNRDKANLGPILCVCYTNHALDQLLEHLLKSGVEQIVRIGSRSRSPLIQGFNLFDLSRRYRQTKAERYLKAKCYSDLDEELNQIMQILRTFQFPNVWQNIQEYLAGHPRHYEELFPSRIDNNGFQKVEVKPNKAIKRWLKGKAQDPSMNRPVSDLLDVSLWEMSRNERKRLYNHWVEGIVKDTTNKLLNSLDEHRKTKDRLDKCHQEVQVRCLEQAHVIGVTVTGLARNIDMLRRISAKVLVCEEAGEVLEAQMLTALLPSIEHAILIGDHEQLRPQIHSYELQHDHPSGKEFSLDVSLFERLINPKTGSGKIPFCTLRTQRRMHPSIAELVRSTIYPQLEDHPSVHEYPGVSGMRDRLFWLNHQQKESGQDSPQTNGYSKTNLFEVEMVNALVSHLVRQGTYAREDIAVITPYLGQLQKLRERLGRAFEIVVAEQDLDDLENQGLLDTTDMSTGDTIMRKRALVHAVRLATVDNFQGEEAKVIVVSLVRSNDEKKCGFLKSSNRINVLLSRAKHGMYIVGNAETARSVPMWADILSMLERNGQIGPQLALCCSRHPGILINVSTPDHFVVLSPEGPGRAVTTHAHTYVGTHANDIARLEFPAPL
ncbi:hypothetical protein PRK78_005572 [Emydomyces testavorans]|uniref:P-loop containing nucleoside triphosphate hydrolase protein n=1 Tax=Emydomyces testavorans TaxID=2070801 RepID=A0AAF0IK64_9EURO|nr:hypothetical protein PRK78_005572 [Emydomyces testavorans]